MVGYFRAFSYQLHGFTLDTRVKYFGGLEIQFNIYSIIGTLLILLLYLLLLLLHRPLPFDLVIWKI